MKIRVGFVSNSSSSCFICGAWGEFKYSIEEVTNFLQKMLNFYNDMEETDLSFNEVFQSPKKTIQEDIELLDGWDVPESKIKGRILIYSKENNSIPWMLCGLIEEKFSAERIHLG